MFIVLLLQIIVGPRIEKQVNSTHEGAEVYHFVFRLLLPTVKYISFGLFGGSFVALFRKVYLKKPWRKVALILGLMFVLANTLVILDYTIGMLIPTYKLFIITPQFLSITQLQPVRSLLFVIFPIISGVLLFLSCNKEPNDNALEFPVVL